MELGRTGRQLKERGMGGGREGGRKEGRNEVGEKGMES